ncbi:DUF1735 domain-containing protein [Pedobacter jamesrossensis]|uniref:DUF1735 domain-containing protein n=1 Tax=Pedobacter jamesrossensis TaxID=1908238 RepID=A0ABV8NMB3_9SPHI
MKKYLTMLLAMCLLSGCLKKDNILDYRGIEPVVMIPNANYPSKGLFAPALIDSAYGTTKLNLIGKYSFQTPPNEDVKIVFAKDDALFTQYNSTLFIKYLPLPAESYELGNLETTIPAGSQTVNLPIKIIPAKLAGPNKYLIAFSIVSAGGNKVAQNSKSMIFTLKGQ